MIIENKIYSLYILVKTILAQNYDINSKVSDIDIDNKTGLTTPYIKIYASKIKNISSYNHSKDQIDLTVMLNWLTGDHAQFLELVTKITNILQNNIIADKKYYIELNYLHNNIDYQSDKSEISAELFFKAIMSNKPTNN